jgi:hypothetical protein
MIMQTLLFVLLHVVGVALCLGFGPARRTHLVGALGFTIGLAATVVIELGMMCLHVQFTAARGIVVLALVIALALARARRRGHLQARACVTLGLWTLGFALASFVLTLKNLSLLSYDSHYIVMMAIAIADDGGFAPGMLVKLGDYGVFEILAHALVCFTRSTYLFGLAPVFAASTAVVFGVTLREALEALGVRFFGRVVLVVLLTAATFSVYMMFRHSFYIHTNLGTSAYLLLFCTMFWLAEVRKDPSFLPVAFVALGALALHRIEAPLICTLFAALAVLPSALPRRALLGGLAAVALGTTIWYAIMASALSPDSAFLTPLRCYTLAAAPVALCGYLALSMQPPLRFLGAVNRRIPAIIVLVCTAALAAAFALRWDHFWVSADAWIQCLRAPLYWAGAWQMIGGFALVGLLVPAPPYRWIFVVGVPAYMALILLLVWGRDPYYVGIGDSATRMSIHLLPMAFFYLGLKYFSLFGRQQDHAPAQASKPGDAREAIVDRG